MSDWKRHLKRAVAICGSQAKLAEEMTRCGAVDCSQQKISWLLSEGDNIAAEDALAVDAATSGAVSAHELRPDLWTNRKHVPRKTGVAA